MLPLSHRFTALRVAAIRLPVMLTTCTVVVIAGCQSLPTEPKAAEREFLMIEDTARIRVIRSRGIIDDDFSHPGARYKSLRTLVHFDVSYPEACCRRDFAVIQFVRHHWRVDEHAGQDAWNLDISDGQVLRHTSGLSFDPTYTTNPRAEHQHEAFSNALVETLTDARGNSSGVVRDDHPGMPESLFDAFRFNGGYFEWRFKLLLVCKQERSTAEHYEEMANVVATADFTIRMHFEGNWAQPTLSDTIHERHFFRACPLLRSVLMKRPALAQAYANPRPHRIEIEVPRSVPRPRV